MLRCFVDIRSVRHSVAPVRKGFVCFFCLQHQSAFRTGCSFQLLCLPSKVVIQMLLKTEILEIPIVLSINKVKMLLYQRCIVTKLFKVK